MEILVGIVDRNNRVFDAFIMAYSGVAPFIFETCFSRAKPGVVVFAHVLVEVVVCFAEQHPVLRAFWPRQAGQDRRHVQFHDCAVHSIVLVSCVKHALCFHVSLDQRDLFVGTAGQGQVAQAFIVDRENTAGGAVLGSHVGDCRTVGQR